MKGFNCAAPGGAVVANVSSLFPQIEQHTSIVPPFLGRLLYQSRHRAARRSHTSIVPPFLERLLGLSSGFLSVHSRLGSCLGELDLNAGASPVLDYAVASGSR